ncbi:hypothetical protein Plhal304r1_c002g0006851 [Plasmopara halstedii]
MSRAPNRTSHPQCQKSDSQTVITKASSLNGASTASCDSASVLILLICWMRHQLRL